MKNNMVRKKNESGMIVVEAVLSFMVFLMVVLSIISLTNVFLVHNKVQFAINSAAHELASYTYLYEATGIHAAADQVHADGEPYVTGLQTKVDHLVDSYNKMQSVYTNIQGGAYGEAAGSMQELTSSVYTSAGDIQNAMENPSDVLAGAIYMGVEYAGNKLSGAAVAGAMRGLSKKYVEQLAADNSPAKDADSYLKGFGVKEGYSELDFSGSSFLQDEHGKVIDVVVSYDMEISFLKLFKQDPSLHMIQRTAVPAWLDGDGDKPSKHGITTD